MTEQLLSEEVTVNIAIRRDRLVDDAKMLAVFLTFKNAGWTGAPMAFQMPNGDVALKLQLDKGDQRILASIGDVIVCIEGVYSAMTADEYTARYGAIEGVA